MAQHALPANMALCYPETVLMIRNVILDWSGTLVDDLAPVLHTTNQVLQEFGLDPMSASEFRREFCLPLRRFYERRAPGIEQQALLWTSLHGE